MPATGPAFRPEQHRWGREFPFYGSGRLNRLCVHPCDRRLRRARARHDRHPAVPGAVSAKYAGDANYEQPMHTDRNHSFLPPRIGAAVVARRVRSSTSRTSTRARADASRDPRATRRGVRRQQRSSCPTTHRSCTRREHAAGPRGSLLAYRPDVFHRGVDLTRPEGASLLVERQLQGRGPGLDRLSLDAVPRERIRHGCSSSSARRRASSRCSASRRPATRSGTTRCCGQRRCVTRSSISIPGATRPRERSRAVGLTTIPGSPPCTRDRRCP